jgi:hypothetical protein
MTTAVAELSGSATAASSTPNATRSSRFAAPLRTRGMSFSGEPGMPKNAPPSSSVTCVSLPVVR